MEQKTSAMLMLKNYLVRSMVKNILSSAKSKETEKFWPSEDLGKRKLKLRARWNREFCVEMSSFMEMIS